MRAVLLILALVTISFAEPDAKLGLRIPDPQGGWAEIDSNLTIHYFDSSGIPVWGTAGIQLESYGQPVLRAANFNPSHALVVLWKESIAGGELWKAQAVDTSGRRLWSEDGLTLHEPTADAASVAALLDDKARVLLSWEESGMESARIHTQRWDQNGQPEWGTGGRLVKIHWAETSHQWKLVVVKRKVFIQTTTQSIRVF